MQIYNSVNRLTYNNRKQEKLPFKKSHPINQPINVIDQIRIKEILTLIIFLTIKGCKKAQL